MIFAEIDYTCSYDEAHEGLENILREHFRHVESGHQGDSWFWVHEGGKKVAIDTFSAMRHQVKSEASGAHVERVVEVLQRYYRVSVKEPPEPEGHE